MSQRIFPNRRQHDGAPAPARPEDRVGYDIGAMHKIIQDAQEKKKKLDRDLFTFETTFLEDASRISAMSKIIKTTTRTNPYEFTTEQSNRRPNVQIRSQDRLFSRCSFTSPLYAPGEPFHRDLVHLINSNIDPQLVLSPQNRPDTPDDYNNMMEYSAGTPRQTRPSEYEQTDDDDDYHDNDSMMDDAASVGTAQDDMDGRFDDPMVDDYNDDSNSGVYTTGTSSRRNSNRMRMSSGSISPGLLTSRKRMSTVDLDYSLRSSKKSKRRR